MEKRNVTLAFVRLGPHEWYNEKMEEKAKQVFSSHPDVELVHVLEHAGWYLIYRRQDMEVVGTANKFAVFPTEVIEYLKSIKINNYVFIN